MLRTDHPGADKEWKLLTLMLLCVISTKPCLMSANRGLQDSITLQVHIQGTWMFLVLNVLQVQKEYNNVFNVFNVFNALKITYELKVICMQHTNV